MEIKWPVFWKRVKAFFVPDGLLFWRGSIFKENVECESCRIFPWLSDGGIDYDLEGQMSSIFQMETPLFYDGFENSRKFYVRYELDVDLDHEVDFDF